MNVLSLFDGMSCGRVALERAGIRVDEYHASEIDKYATQISQKNYSDIVRHGDINNIDFKQFKGKIDLIIGGSPCQDLSIAKPNRQGLKGERSGLFWKYVESLDVVRPEFFMLENVASMHNDDRDAITETLMKLYPNVECIMINSALVSAQQRKRYYWTNWKNEQPVDKGIFLKDIIERGQAFDEKAYCLTGRFASKTTSDYLKKRASFVAESVGCAFRTWPRIKKEGIERIKRPECRIDGKTNALTLVETDCMICEPVIFQIPHGFNKGGIKEHKSPTLTSGAAWEQNNKLIGPLRVGQLPGLGSGQANRIYSIEGKTVCLNALGGGGGAKTGLYAIPADINTKNVIVVHNGKTEIKGVTCNIKLPDGIYHIRKLTPMECERLQTLPDGYTEGVSDTQRYKMLGNGWTVDVIAHILKGIEK